MYTDYRKEKQNTSIPNQITWLVFFSQLSKKKYDECVGKKYTCFDDYL